MRGWGVEGDKPVPVSPGLSIPSWLVANKYPLDTVAAITIKIFVEKFAEILASAFILIG